MDIVLDMSVCKNQVQPPVIIILEPFHPECNLGYCLICDPKGRGMLAEESAAVVVIDGLGFMVECCNQEVQLAIIVVVSPVKPHSAVDISGGIIGCTGA